jgi:hypothetical protein
VFVVSSNLQVTTVDQELCELQPGDILRIWGNILRAVLCRLRHRTDELDSQP